MGDIVDQDFSGGTPKKRVVGSAPPVPKGLHVEGSRQIPVVDQTAAQPRSAGSNLRPLTNIRPSKPVPAALDASDAPIPPITTNTDTKEESALPTPAEEVVSPKRNFIVKFARGFWRHKLWSLPLVLLVIVGIVFALPVSRYPILALALKRSYRIELTDIKTNTPVSGAIVTLDGQTATTDGKGDATLTVRVGKRLLTIQKKYYQTTKEMVFVGLSPKGNSANLQLAATGRQVPIKVVNKLTGQPLASAEIKFLGTEAKADDKGLATIVLPTSKPTQSVTVTEDGFNALTATVQVTSNVVAANTLAMVPIGRVYFLSNLSGKLDVVSTNLDGSSRKTVLAGTGSEDESNTVLLASRDWRYLALMSKRSGNYTQLYLINTTNDQTTPIDSSVGNYIPIGWSGHYFVYKFNDPTVQSWQPDATILKSFNADTGKTITLASTSASGTSSSDAQYQAIIDTMLLGGNVVYTITWYQGQGYLTVSGQQDTLVSVSPDGSTTKALKSVDAGQYYISNLKLATPSTAYFGVYSNASTSTNFYRVDGSGFVSQSSTITSNNVTQDYPSYLLSPSSTKTFWSEPRDGKNTLLVGDSNAANATQIATLSDYTPYGWFSDDYLLVEKGGNELYIMPATGGTALKVSDYYKPQYSPGFDGSYGGL